MARSPGGWFGDAGSGYVQLEGRAGLPSQLLRAVVNRRSSEPALWLYVAGSGIGAALGAATHRLGAEGANAVPALACVAGGAAAGAGAVWLVFASTAITTPLELVPLRVALRDVIDPAGRGERELHHLGLALRRAGLRVVAPIDGDDAEAFTGGRAHGRDGLQSVGFVWEWPDRSVRIEVTTDHAQALTYARIGIEGPRRQERDATLTIDGRVVPARRLDASDGGWVLVAAFEGQGVTVDGRAVDDVDPDGLRLRALPLGELPSISTQPR